MVTNRRQTAGKESTEVRYFLSSLDVDVNCFERAVRGHWSIENACHWCLDVTFGEDKDRTRKDHASANLGALRRTALSLLKREKSAKVGVKNKRLTAAWNTDYLRKVLFSA